MGFEVFDKSEHFNGPRPKYLVPEVGIPRSGSMSLNVAAFEALGEPEAVLLLFDPIERVIGLRPSLRSDPKAFAVTARKGRTPVVAANRFLKHFGVDRSAARRYPARMVEGVLAVPLMEDRANLRAVS